MDKQYIDKSALLAEIEERRDNLISLSESCPANTAAKSGFYAQAQTLEGIKNFIDTLDVVKEVDLEKEFDFNAEVTKFIDTFYKNTKIGHRLMIRRTAKYFFDLALKATK